MFSKLALQTVSKTRFLQFARIAQSNNLQFRSFRTHGPQALNCDHLLTPEQIQLRNLVEDFAKKEIQPLAESIDKSDNFPRHLYPLMGQMGILGPTAPVEFGGLALSYLDHILIMETLAKASTSVALSYGTHSNLCVNQITRWGSPEQKSKYLPKLIDGSLIGGLSMSEVGSGSDVVSMKTAAVEDGDYFVINGGKMWITNGNMLDLVVCYARTSSDRNRGITAFLVDRTIPGFHIAQKLDKLGMRGTETAELVFEDMRVHKSAILGGLNNGVTVLMSGLDSERLVLSSGPIGLMQACYDVSLPYINTRKQFDQFIGDFQLVQGKIADMYTTLLSHRSFLYSTAIAYANKKAGRADCASVILSCAEKCTQVALDAIQLLGGNGYINDYPVGRFLRDAKLFEIGAGTSEIRRFLIGRELNATYRA